MTSYEGEIFSLVRTFIELTITLASAVLIGMVTFFDDVTGAGVPPEVVKLSVICMALSIAGGLAFFMRMIGMLTDDQPSSSGAGGTDQAVEKLGEGLPRFLASLCVVAYFAGVVFLGISLFSDMTWLTGFLKWGI